MHRKNLDDTKYLMVPPKDERTSIIEKNYKIGHPQTDGTYQRIIIKYFWFDMILNIKNYIKRCGACQRNERSKVFNHPAKAIEVTRLFGCVSLDYVFGLEPSKVIIVSYI